MPRIPKFNQDKYSDVRKLIEFRKEGIISEEEFKSRLRLHMAQLLYREYVDILRTALGGFEGKPFHHAK